jgi:hypothetical protein
MAMTQLLCAVACDRCDGDNTCCVPLHGHLLPCRSVRKTLRGGTV